MSGASALAQAAATHLGGVGGAFHVSMSGRGRIPAEALMLVTGLEILKRARAEGYDVGAFNTNSMGSPRPSSRLPRS